MRASIRLASTLLAVLFAQDIAVPVEDEPNHRTVFKNEFVQAFRVTLQPGTSTMMHIHAHDDAAVRLSEATTTQQVLGQAVSPADHVLAGGVSARDNEMKPLTHRVNNVGDSVFDVIDVQILKRPAGPAAPQLTAPEAENATMRVYRYELASGAGSPQHAHARPYLIVAATDMDLRMTSADGAVMEHGIKVGDLLWIESAVTHTLANRGSATGIVVEIELK